MGREVETEEKSAAGKYDTIFNWAMFCVRFLLLAVFLNLGLFNPAAKQA